MKDSPLEKVVAERAGLSRRQAAQAIRRGRVSVDGTPIRSPRLRIALDASVLLDGASLRLPPTLVVWHKPAGILCTLRDEWGRPTLWTALPDLLQGGLRPVGRLDLETSGLLLLSRDGALTQRVLHPKRAVPRTYRARVEGQPGSELIAALTAGVETAEGVFTADEVTVDGPDVRLTVFEGKHRMVRRMLANAGHPVVDLRRLALGPFTLGELPSGQWREPTDAEAAWCALTR